MNFLHSLALFLGLISLGSALECYVCREQPDNRDKCIKTTIQCREHQDTCRTFIHWRQPKYWTPRSERIYSIDKSCAVRSSCEQEQKTLGLECMRNWYRDWKCTECCQGDRCNYYVTLGASGVKISMALLVTAFSALQIILRLR
ncbi:uncharacterized protein LOC132738543 [Ruditapes philippinarum]|uniref:uncharacterized protein LOC132738543 n=1 Tax=Ruditapes philippinarum TaxID=129788 RepID=UPI00295BC375|nr:uncharacterized protein LOC132738543 [Ruditapes philippinarum]